MKNIKTDKQTKPNKLLTMQLRIKICGVDIEKFDPEKSITLLLIKTFKEKRKRGHSSKTTTIYLKLRSFNILWS